MHTKTSSQIIMHVDMDAFFAAVEERNNPQLTGLPIVVGTNLRGRVNDDHWHDRRRDHHIAKSSVMISRLRGGPVNCSKSRFSRRRDYRVQKSFDTISVLRGGRGVVSTANYKARAYGIHSAMPITKAWRLSEYAFQQGQGARAVFLPPHFRTYGDVSRRIMTILKTYSPLVEVTSIDEAYLEVRITDYKRAEKIALQIKEKIREKEKLTCSIGIGPNKLIAKIASGFQKPDGLTMVSPEEVEKFLAPLPIRIIPGVGPKTEAFLHEKGIITIANLKELLRINFNNWLGKWGEDLYYKARGIDNRPINTEWHRKSLGHQETLPFDTLKTSLLIKLLRGLTHETLAQLQKEKLRCRTIEVTVRFADFETKTRSKTLANSTSNYELIWHTALSLFLPFLNTRENPHKKLIRLLGVAVGKF